MNGPTAKQLAEAHATIVDLCTNGNAAFLVDLDLLRRAAQVLADVSMRIQLKEAR